MFGFSLAEMGIFIIVLLLVIKPEDIPGVIKSVVKAFNKLKKSAQEISNLIKNELELDDIKREAESIQHEIIGDDGDIYKAYDVSELAEFKPKDQPIDNPPKP